MLNLKNILMAFAIGLAVGALPAWYFTAEYKDAKWGKAVDDQKIKAAATLQAETEKVLAAERKNTELNNKLEMANATANQKINATLADNRRLALQLGGLRDPGRRSGCGGSAPGIQPPAIDSTAPTGGELSAEATEFLLEFAADADRTAEYAKTCHDWAVGVTVVR